MKNFFVKDSLVQIGKDVTVYGWVSNLRDHKKIVFIDLRDSTGILQVVGDERFRDLHPEDVVKISGTIKKRPEKLINKKVETGEIELQAKDVEVLSHADTLPFDMGKEDLEVTLPTLLDYRSLTLRHPKVKSIFKVQEALMDGFRKISKSLRCTEVIVPEITITATEGGAEVFGFDYYEHTASLTQSPQLYKQMVIPALERVYLIAHAYRAEPSVTTRHLAESVQMDCEFGFVEFEELLDLLEKVAVETIAHAEKACKKELKEHNVSPVLVGKIPRLTLKEAQEVIKKETGRNVVGEKDLSPEDEVDICKWAEKEKKSDFVTVTHFPTRKRAFYTMPDPKNPELSLSYDILFRGLEIASGSQRVHEYEKLVKTIKDRGMNPDDFEMYLMAFQYGMPPEGGFSFGLERLTKTLLQLPNVREAALFPRDMERVDVRLSKKRKK
ncbi:aspartate--tRNA(Asn) ligase [Candidatus Roizmanbacteria bacterium RIFCSPLOWO2_12_FULL_40_12]|uniref:Aspartate--tRNA(Asn) ligase n=1 Tax=Candidatus Roizmanbacteria bacterium RIFCSPLOWO2_01_FULL_40_42 TaxID=1802066 RepID=A0A1F7J504_9BACT|nr:MAG: aspartate--tRNA(Asn) ligase [Candidatus Roizmanbacteria bacterium RIFCSPHIGHO2_01_FULL_40_98]OGK29043.1 MAG: aspartate--tRNA(Asn) ligase [Candidatus Roizmanbacteria bacterium RIFCSPHIGHO2_02_FULL_40_53]OGK29971.1 MAG: aspartate--tRNA(Asn) ligase [Candidatus Roizmanbacteria bacterium RIFCSPHIGHO2_12_41_18]OGK36298.1 MAG: aspartate--tRNA(Asn) ligase [Candidatus Roizmanbacteria bacterium RIFCSPHIGHO2_12_FULL_40_130]OGK50670.1 MAG: aspartate--tRNA(Asn) ligase [Candidatus Roizmanbacteria bac